MNKKRTYLRDGRAPIPKSEKISKVMSANRGKNTSPELKLRRMLRLSGLRGYKLHSKDIAGRPDIAFSKDKIAIFLDGCFWHGCPTCFVAPRTNRAFWLKKIRVNRTRDSRVKNLLRREGWKPIRIWEHELKTDKIPKRLALFIEAN